MQVRVSSSETTIYFSEMLPRAKLPRDSPLHILHRRLGVQQSHRGIRFPFEQSSATHYSC
jgi:hypothetical protein